MSTIHATFFELRGAAARHARRAESAMARAEEAEAALAVERARIADLERTLAGLRGLAQMLIERLDRTTPVRHDGPGDVW